MTEELSRKKDTESIEEPVTETEQVEKQSSDQGNNDGNAVIEELKRKLEAVQKQSDTYKDQLLRKAAEFDNYKKRSEADYVNMVKIANEALLNSLIPILEDFTRSLKAGRETKDQESFYKGIELIYNKFTKALESHGLIAFDSVGKPFDVDYHDALLQVQRQDVPPHTVVEEIERGYKLFDKIIRHAKVIVSAEPEVQPSETSANTKQDEAGKN
jgi:molecular chaperone GrpE